MSEPLTLQSPHRFSFALSEIDRAELIKALEISIHVTKKCRAQARKSGYFQAAKNLRKQGFPIELARAILL